MANSDQKTASKQRKVYVKPELKSLGPLHKLTQGSTGTLGDGGGSKRTK
jgi:hypothetical protein